MKLTIGFSPCPNDTFIFDALVNKKIEYEGIELEPVLEDVQTLNNWAKEGKLDISKLSFPALFDNADKYAILPSGSALGKGVGPLLVAKKMIDVPDMDHYRIAIPGENTTANFLLSFALPGATNRIPTLFSDIEDAVVEGKVDLGLIIHENRFTYHLKHLVKIMDLGEVWEQKQQLPIPLGCIAIKRNIDIQVQHKLNNLIQKSLQYSFDRYPDISPYVQQHAQAMDEAVMRKHIDLYVNDYTMNLGESGKKAIMALYEVYTKQKTAPGAGELGNTPIIL
jgi:1,4-dihydroxy-6-naphthoate synthase